MKIQKRREIVIEFEHVRLVRRKARTHLGLCRACGGEIDFVALREAAALFTTPADTLLGFIRAQCVHFETAADGEIFVCLVSLLAAMRRRNPPAGVRRLGD